MSKKKANSLLSSFFIVSMKLVLLAKLLGKEGNQFLGQEIE